MLTCINMNITSFQRNFSSNRTGLKQMISTCLGIKAICCIRASGVLFFSVLTHLLFSLLQPSYIFLTLLLQSVKCIQ